MRRLITVLGLLLFTLALGACSTPHVVQEKKVSDATLNCQQLKEEIAAAEEFRKKAEKEKGVTGTNVAAAVFFWPAMIATYKNAGEAIEAANKRKSNLIDLYREKKCK